MVAGGVVAAEVCDPESVTESVVTPFISLCFICSLDGYKAVKISRALRSRAGDCQGLLRQAAHVAVFVV